MALIAVVASPTLVILFVRTCRRSHTRSSASSTGVFSYFSAGRLVASAAHAKPVTKGEQPELVRAVENSRSPPARAHADRVHHRRPRAQRLRRRAQAPDAYVAATTGLVALMDQRELEGVVAHEISHIRNRDVRLMTLAAVLVGVIALMADMLMRAASSAAAGATATTRATAS